MPINGYVRQKASQVFDDLVFSSKENPTLFSKLISIAGNESIKNQVQGAGSDFSDPYPRVVARHGA
jgi:hypothetical protein